MTGHFDLWNSSGRLRAGAARAGRARARPVLPRATLSTPAPLATMASCDGFFLGDAKATPAGRVPLSHVLDNIQRHVADAEEGDPVLVSARSSLAVLAPEILRLIAKLDSQFDAMHPQLNMLERAARANGVGGDALPMGARPQQVALRRGLELAREAIASIKRSKTSSVECLRQMRVIHAMLVERGVEAVAELREG